MTVLSRTSTRPQLVEGGLGFLALALLAILGSLTVDLYIPAFPAMQEDLSVSPTAVQLTLTATTMGFAVGQLAVGPLSDVVGRRRPLIVATLVHVAASVAVATAPTLDLLLAARFVQGVGSAGGAVVAMAMVRDVAQGRALLRLLARLALFSGLAPVVAPLIGAELLRVVDWRGLFVVVAAYGLAVLALAAKALPDTLEPARRLDGDARAHLRVYVQLLGNRRFMGVAVIGGLLVSAVFAFITTSSFLFQERYHLSLHAYGRLFALNAVAFALGSQLASIAARRFSPESILSCALPALSLSGFALVVEGKADTGLAPIAATVTVFMLAAGTCAPCLQVIAMSDQADNAGTAAALLGATNYGMAGLASPVAGAFGVDSVVPLGLLIGTSMGAGALILGLLVLPGRMSRDQGAWSS